MENKLLTIEEINQKIADLDEKEPSYQINLFRLLELRSLTLEYMKKVSDTMMIQEMAAKYAIPYNAMSEFQVKMALNEIGRNPRKYSDYRYHIDMEHKK